ncbi:MAG: thioredoxin family protein [Candidatus Bipolaricaulota bacterium]|nr:thioredoxin family protein [Candidatus Bipolaricaulota bacterium]MDW8329259.1 thioredoxin family protein [Candidatus Bipolaricaulota bacterium]
MPLLTEQNKKQVQKVLEELVHPVTIHYFTQEFECEPCQIAHELLKEVTALSNKLTLKVYEFKNEQEIAQRFGVDKIPAIVLEGQKAYGIRFFGVPAGYEFGAFLEDLVDVSRGVTQLSAETQTLLNTLLKPIHIQVFVTPTCPYCPAAVRLAHKMALYSDKVKADMVSALEFPYLADKYDVYGVPKTVVNDGVVMFEGALPEREFVARVLQAA